MCDMTAVETHARVVAQMDVKDGVIAWLVNAGTGHHRALLILPVVMIMAAVIMWWRARAATDPQLVGTGLPDQ